jgi:hypothetical protein
MFKYVLDHRTSFTQKARVEQEIMCVAQIFFTIDRRGERLKNVSTTDEDDTVQS